MVVGTRSRRGRARGLARPVAALVLAACGGGPASTASPVGATTTPPSPPLRLDHTGLVGADLRPPVTVAALPGRVPGYRAQASTEWYESGPDDPVPVICLVRRGRGCDLVLFTDEAGQVTRIRVLDPAVPGPGGLVVGAAHAAVADRLTPCVAVDGAERGLRCGVRGVDNVEVWMALGDDVALDPTTEVPPATALAAAQVTYLWWWRPGT